MESGSLADLIRSGFEDIVSNPATFEAYHQATLREPLLTGVSLAEVPALVHDGLPSEQANSLLAAVVRSYQRGPHQVWGCLVLEMLAPALMDVAAKLHLQPASLTDEDLYQQVAVETLHVAARVRTTSGHWTKLRIVRQVRKRLVRSLKAEMREQHPGQDALDQIVVEAEQDDWDDADMLSLRRMKLDGENAEQLAAERGLRIHQMRYRLRIARQRALRDVAA